jgi:hypothetical protein
VRKLQHKQYVSRSEDGRLHDAAMDWGGLVGRDAVISETRLPHITPVSNDDIRYEIDVHGTNERGLWECLADLHV